MSFEAERRVYDYLERLNLLASGHVEGAERSRWVADVRRRIESGRAEYGSDEVGTARAIAELGDPAKLLERELKPRTRQRRPGTAPAAPEPRFGPPAVSVPMASPPRAPRRPADQTIGSSPPVTDPYRTPDKREARQPGGPLAAGSLTAGSLKARAGGARRTLGGVGAVDALAVAGLALGGVLFPAWIVGLVATVRTKALRLLEKAGVITLLAGGGGVGGALAYDDAAPRGTDGLNEYVSELDIETLVTGVSEGLTGGGLFAAAFYAWRLVERRRVRLSR